MDALESLLAECVPFGWSKNSRDYHEYALNNDI